MRSIFARRGLLILALAVPALLRAQFQPPTDEELKMTADPKAPGAAAVYLNVEEITDDPLHYKSFYARIKVLEEKGKELATVEIPYEAKGFKVSDIKARTIHADGTVIPLGGRPEDILVAKTGEFQLDRKVFTLPSAEVGCILEYRYQIHYDDDHLSSPFWNIQRPYFVHKAHYAFTPFAAFISGARSATNSVVVDEHGNAANSLLRTWLLPAGAGLKIDSFGHFSLDMEDIKPIADEDWMPPVSSLLYHVQFYYKDAYDAADFWQTESKNWSKSVDHFAEPSKPIREAVKQLTAPGDSDLDKARKLYKAVQALDNTDFSRRKTESELKRLNIKVARRAEDTWAQKSGSAEDIALLYLAMLRAAGLSAYAMKVVNRDEGVFDLGYLTLYQLNDVIILLDTGGKEMVLDPGEKMCPFQTVHWRHSGVEGIRQSPDGRFAASSPYQAYAANSIQRTGDVVLDNHGAFTAAFRIVMNGQEALRWRQSALLNDEDEAKKRFDEWLKSTVPEGVEAHIDHFQELDNPDASLVAMVKATGSLGSTTSRRMQVPAFFFETHSAHPFVDQAQRVEPVDMHYGDQVTDQVIYHLPEGFGVEGAPQDARLPWEGHAVLVFKTKTEPGQITIARTLSRAFTVAKPEEYQSLRDFYRKVAASDEQQLVLTNSQTAKGQ